ncbi:MAG: mechanosensitive ion channel domain-containing protein [Vicinamibacteria bacterium]
MDQIRNFLLTRGVDFVVQLLAAVALYIVGRWVIWGLRGVVRRALAHQKFDTTVSKYLEQTIGVVLLIALALAVLGVLGVQTTSLAGLLAAAGVAIGVAWSGLLANFAAGIIVVTLRPFKKGDTVQLGGVVGEVLEIGLFGTLLAAGDGARVIVGNSRVFSDNIHNLSTGAHRRVEARAQLPWAADPTAFYAALRARLAEEPKVLKMPATVVETLEHNATGPVAVVRAHCVPTDYGELFFLTQRVIGEEIVKAGFSPPNPTGASRNE